MDELPHRSGFLSVNGKVAYVDQNSKIFSGTLEENIIISKELDQERFDKVCKYCCLKDDIDKFKDGAKVEIGEMGTNLSSG